MTNFRASQPGQVRARFRLMPYAWSFDELRAHRFGAEAAQALPVAQSLGEAPAGEPPLAPAGPLLRLPQGNVLTLRVKRAEDSTEVIVRLYNPTGQDQPAVVGSGLLKISEAALCDLFESPVQAAAVEAGEARVTVPARQLVVLRLNTGAA